MQNYSTEELGLELDMASATLYDSQFGHVTVFLAKRGVGFMTTPNKEIEGRIDIQVADEHEGVLQDAIDNAENELEWLE